MPGKQPLAQVVLVLLVAAFFVFGFVHWWNRRPSPTDVIVAPPDPFRVDVISQEVANPGKVIRASVDGRVAAEYVCGPEDAAVAVVAVSHPDLGISVLAQTVEFTINDAKDDQDKLYECAVHRKGDFIFVVLLRGFSHWPPRITVEAKCYPLNSASVNRGPTLSIPFTRFALPERFVSVPNAAAQQEAEKVAVAEYVDKPGVLLVKSTAKPKKDEFFSLEVVATSFSPSYESGQAGAGRDADAVKVRVDRFQKQTSEINLIYKNARIVKVNGLKTLTFPITERVGTIDGCPAIISKDAGGKVEPAGNKHAHGDVKVHLERASAPPQPRSGRITCVGMSPGTAELGLEFVRVHVDRYELDQVFPADVRGRTFLRSVIPELTIKFRHLKNVKVASSTIVLPVHHVDQDPKYFPPAAIAAPRMGGAPMPSPGPAGFGIRRAGSATAPRSGPS